MNPDSIIDPNAIFDTRRISISVNGSNPNSEENNTFSGYTFPFYRTATTEHVVTMNSNLSFHSSKQGTATYRWIDAKGKEVEDALVLKFLNELYQRHIATSSIRPLR